MTDLRTAAQQALEAHDKHEPLAVVMESLRAALAEPVQSAEHWKHVANLWVDPETQDYVVDRCEHPLSELIPVYTAPPQRKPLPASDIVTMYDERPMGDSDMIEFARAIERAHGIKE